MYTLNNRLWAPKLIEYLWARFTREQALVTNLAHTYMISKELWHGDTLTKDTQRFVYGDPAIHYILNCLINGIFFLFYLTSHIWCLKVYMIICMYDRDLYVGQFLDNHIQYLKLCMIFCVYDHNICWSNFGQSSSHLCQF